MGPYRIAVHLTQQGELTRRGTQWNAASVRNILGNAIYTGIRTYGAIQTERFSHLQIVSDELYLCAQQKLQACRLEEPRPLRSQHWDAVLLKDRPYCMHCGKPVTVSRGGRSCPADIPQRRPPRRSCPQWHFEDSRHKRGFPSPQDTTALPDPGYERQRSSHTPAEETAAFFTCLAGSMVISSMTARFVETA